MPPGDGSAKRVGDVTFVGNATLLLRYGPFTVGLHAPGTARFLLPPVMGTVLELFSPEGDVRHRLYITGDTLMHGALAKIAQRCARPDMTVLHLGGTTLPGGLMVTMDGRQGAGLLELIRPRRALPVHYDDNEAFRSPLSDFRAEVDRRGLGDLVTWAERGDTVALG